MIIRNSCNWSFVELRRAWLLGRGCIAALLYFLRGSVHSGYHKAMDKISLAPFVEQTKSLSNFGICLDAVNNILNI